MSLTAQAAAADRINNVYLGLTPRGPNLSSDGF
jgi:hypothetical protein